MTVTLSCFLYRPTSTYQGDARLSSQVKANKLNMTTVVNKHVWPFAGLKRNLCKIDLSSRQYPRLVHCLSISAAIWPATIDDCRPRPYELCRSYWMWKSSSLSCCVICVFFVQRLRILSAVLLSLSWPPVFVCCLSIVFILFPIYDIEPFRYTQSWCSFYLYTQTG